MVVDPKQTYLREEYIARINRVIDYVQTHLDQNLTLETLAGVAGFSPFHFHRLFGALVGETLGQFIQPSCISTTPRSTRSTSKSSTSACRSSRCKADSVGESRFSMIIGRVEDMEGCELTL